MNTQKMKEIVKALATIFDMKSYVFKPHNLGTSKRGLWTIEISPKTISFFGMVTFNDVLEITKKNRLMYYFTAIDRDIVTKNTCSCPRPQIVLH